MVIKQFLKKIILGNTYPLLKSRRDYAWKFPRTVHIENTNICNARCTMCSMDVMTRKTGVMSFEQFELLIHECSHHPEVREVHLHGFGEPLVDKDLPKKITLAKKLGLPFTYIVTNASLMSAKKAKEIIKAGLVGIKFSFYGMSAANYERIHRGLKFHKTVKNIETFLKVRDSLKSLTPRVRLQFCPDMAPLEELDMFCEKWRPLMDADRGDLLYITGLHNWAGGKNIIIPKLLESERFCRWPFNDIQILWDGRVVPCVFDYDAKIVLGDVTQASIAQIWQSEEYERFREIWIMRKSSSIPLCAKCDEPEGGYRPHPLGEEVQPLSRGVVPKMRKYFFDSSNEVIRLWKEVKMSFLYRNHIS
jgi:radical SAM protein with 4Fe4S-binding SPASM domain